MSIVMWDMAVLRAAGLRMSTPKRLRAPEADLAVKKETL
jgi:hypothetical protein